MQKRFYSYFNYITETINSLEDSSVNNVASVERENSENIFQEALSSPYYDDGNDSTQLPISSIRQESEIIPEIPIHATQNFLSDILLDRIQSGFFEFYDRDVMKLHNFIFESKQDIWTWFTSMDFLIITPNRIVLERQTVERICKTPNVLPHHIAQLDEGKKILKFL